MKSLHKLRIFSLAAIVVLALSGCKKEAVIPEVKQETKTTIPTATAVNNFVWEGMHDYYLWTANVNNLSAPKFSNKDTLNAFLNRYSDPSKLFDDLLYQYGTVDKWSFIVADYTEIENWISGISKSMGYDFMLARIGSSDNVFGFVRYVLKDSPAEKAGLKRGDLFTKVNGTQLTVSNYNSLLFGSDSYSLTLATYASATNTITTGTTTLSMTAVELQENPVYLNKVIDVNGTKTGYLVYNGFTSDFDIELNKVFADFKQQGIQKLILDLRYNGGGSVQTAIYLASMIYSTDKTKILSKSKYNALLQDYYISKYGNTALNDYFANKIEAVTDSKGNVVVPEAAINSLGLSQVYFLVSDNTASASEMLINSLKPYMTVKVIGTNTYGKYVGSATLKDYDSSGNLNTTHQYAMQPIIVKIANSQDVSDYVNGLSPDITAEEDIVALLPFGDENETLLKVALNDIKGISTNQASLKKGLSASEVVGGRRTKMRFANEMYVKSLSPVESIK